MINRDYLKGAEKIRKIMNNKIVYRCRACGMSHERYRQAIECCKKVKIIPRTHK